jgi:hypothetical protein
VAKVFVGHVREALSELSDVQYQRRVWTGQSEREMSSFIEAVEYLYTDSGLSDALDRGEPVFGTAIDDRLRDLGDALQKLNTNRSEIELIDDPAMQPIRDSAAAILRSIEGLPPGDIQER